MIENFKLIKRSMVRIEGERHHFEVVVVVVVVVVANNVNCSEKKNT